MSNNTGIGLGGVCFLATLAMGILKLAGVISWSWWLVFLPLLATIGVTLLVMLIVILVAVTVGIIRG